MRIRLLRYFPTENALEQAISIAPNYADGYGLLVLISNNLGEPEQALEFATKGMLLNPYYTWDYPYNLGRAYYTLGRYDDVIESLTGTLERNENAVSVRLFLAVSYVQADRREDAEWEIVLDAESVGCVGIDRSGMEGLLRQCS